MESLSLPEQGCEYLSEPQRRNMKPYKCRHCAKDFATNNYLSQHLRIHLGLKPYGPCTFCGKKFTQLSHLQQHTRTHTGERPYACVFAGCRKTFSQLSNLHSHSRRHQIDKPFKCSNCYKCFTNETALTAHIDQHRTSNHCKVHVCSYCGRSYTQPSALAKHMSKHASTNDGSMDGAVDKSGPVWDTKNTENVAFDPEKRGNHPEKSELPPVSPNSLDIILSGSEEETVGVAYFPLEHIFKETSQSQKTVNGNNALSGTLGNHVKVCDTESHLVNGNSYCNHL